MQYRLRTLLILLAILPLVLAVVWWKYSVWRAEQERLESLLRQVPDGGTVYSGLRLSETGQRKPATPNRP
jgi:hypothetical protein